MLRHIVFFDCKDPANADRIFEGLSLLKRIPHSLHLEIGRNLKVDVIDGMTPDFVVYGEFEDEAQLQAFKAHPDYEKSIELVRPLRGMRIAADFHV